VVALEVPVIGVGSRCATHRITSRGFVMAQHPPSDLPISCAKFRRAADLQRRSSGEDRYAHLHARTNAHLSSRSAQTSARS
jgi:hypothetical protein